MKIRLRSTGLNDELYKKEVVVKMVKRAENIVSGDVLEYDGFQNVAIDDYYNGFLWATTEEWYNKCGGKHGLYWYTNATILQIPYYLEITVTKNLRSTK